MSSRPLLPAEEGEDPPKKRQNAASVAGSAVHNASILAPIFYAEAAEQQATTNDMQPLQHLSLSLQHELRPALHQAAASLSNGRDNRQAPPFLSADTAAVSAASLGSVPRDGHWDAYPSPFTTFVAAPGYELPTSGTTRSIHSASTGAREISSPAEQQRFIHLRARQLLAQNQLSRQSEQFLNAYNAPQQNNEMIQQLLLQSQIQQRQKQRQNLLLQQVMLRQQYGRESFFGVSSLANRPGVGDDNNVKHPSLTTAVTMFSTSDSSVASVGLKSDVTCKSGNIATPVTSATEAAPPGAKKEPQATNTTVAMAAPMAEPPRPKKWLTAYNLFFKDERVKLLGEMEGHLSEGPGKEHHSARRKTKIGFEEMARIIGKHWKGLDPQRREQYQYQAAQGKKQYEDQLKEFKRKKCDLLEAKRQQQEATVSESTRNQYFETAGGANKRKSGSISKSRQNKNKKNR